MTNPENFAYTPPSARQLLHDHGLPEDVIDGVLCLHAQELAAAIRAETEALKADGVLEPDKFRPCRDAANQIDPTVHDDTDLSEADIDRMMAVATPVQIVTAPPGTFAAVSVPPPATRADDQAAFVAEAEAKLTAGCPDHGPNGGWLMTCQCETIGVLQDLAAEQQPGGPCVAGEQQNETPEAEAGCAHCGGPHAWDDCEAYTALVSEEQPPTDKEPEPGDRVRVTYEGTWLADDDPRTLLVGNHSGDIWRNIAPDHARVEVLPAAEAPE